DTLPPLQRAHAIAVESGDFAYGGYAGFDYCTHGFLIGKALPELKSDIEHYARALEQMGQQSALSYLQSYQQGAECLMAPGPDFHELSGSVMNESRAIELFKQQNNLAGLWHLYTAKLPLAFMFENYEHARELASLAKQYISAGTSGVAVPIQNFYD